MSVEYVILVPPLSSSLRSVMCSLFGEYTSGSKEVFMPSYPVQRVFVVDDEHVIASTLASILNFHGYSARFFTEPMHSLAAALSDVPDLLISDVAMPSLSGVDLAIQMRAQCPKCKILLFSGQATTLNLLANASAQGHDFHLLLKPIHPSELLAQMGTLGD